MIRLPILPMDVKASERHNPYLSRASLPTDYMSDYSVLGLVVDRCQEAIRALEESGFSVIRHTGGAEVVLDRFTRVQNVTRIFEIHAFDFGVHDIIDQVYQG